jgi:hypothetical protein
MTGVTGCCAPAANGQTVADPAIALMKSRRRIAFPKAQGCADYCSHRIRLQQGFAAGEMGLGVSLYAAILSRYIEVRPPDVCFTPESGHCGPRP